MKTIIGAAVLGVALAGPSTALGVEGAPVRIFDTGQISPDQYTVLRRLWTGTWRAAFWIPQEADAGAAITSITAAAARAGADGVVNFHCVADRGEYFCYGLAIKLK